MKYLGCQNTLHVLRDENKELRTKIVGYIKKKEILKPEEQMGQ